MSKKRKKIYSQIKGISQLQRQKRLLEKKIKIRERLLNKHINDFSDDFSGDYVYRQSIKTLKLDSAMWKIAPQFLKGNKKGLIIPLLSGVVATMASVLFYKNKDKNTSAENANFNAEEKN